MITAEESLRVARRANIGATTFHTKRRSGNRSTVRSAAGACPKSESITEKNTGIVSVAILSFMRGKIMTDNELDLIFNSILVKAKALEAEEVDLDDADLCISWRMMRDIVTTAQRRMRKAGEA